jgi:hypothetical protein
MKEAKKMKKILYLMVMFVAFAGMMLMFSTTTMAATAPEGGFAGTSIEKGSMNNVTYETGGVGLEERTAMQKSIHAYNLRLTFATIKGAYLSDVPVEIKTLQGKVVLSKASNGPWFWVNLPAGQYEVAASFYNKKEIHKIDVGKAPRRIEFTWKHAM